MLLVGGPRFDYVQPVVTRSRHTSRAAGVRCSCSMRRCRQAKSPLLRMPLLTAQLAAWGVIANKDLVLDTSGIGQIFGFSEVILLVTSYESHAIVREMKGVATAFPLARTLDVKTGGKWTPEKLFSTSENSFATTNLGAQGNSDRSGEGQEGSADARRGGFEWDRAAIVVVGSSSWLRTACSASTAIAILFLNMINWLSSDEELISIRPKDPEDRRLALNRSQMTMIFYTSVLLLPLAVIARWYQRVVEAEVAEYVGSRSSGRGSYSRRSCRRRVLVRAKQGSRRGQRGERRRNKLVSVKEEDVRKVESSPARQRLRS